MHRKHIALALCAVAAIAALGSYTPAAAKTIHLPTSKLLRLPVPGHPQKTNSFPTALALSPNGRYLAVLNNGYGTEESSYDESIAVLDLTNNHLTDFPDPRLRQKARQTYFLGLAFSSNGRHLYASFASLTDPTGEMPGDTGNGIGVFRFENGRPAPEGFLKLPLQPLGAAQRYPTTVSHAVPAGKADPYPAGIAVVAGPHGDRLLVADNLSDDALLVDAATGKTVHRFDLSRGGYVPAVFPYAAVATHDGHLGFVSLWNDSAVAELDLLTGKIVRRISLLRPASPTAPGSHPSALLLSRDERYLFVALSNADRVAVINVAQGSLAALLSTELPGQEYSGTYPNALAESSDGKLLFAADAAADDVAVFRIADFDGAHAANPRLVKPFGFLPTEWYPTALAVHGDDLFIATGKGQGTTANALAPAAAAKEMARVHRSYKYIATLLYGSVARVSIPETSRNLPALTAEVEVSNGMKEPQGSINFAAGSNPIKHVIYIIKENRTYDQIFGDLKPGNGDPALTMWGWNITPNEHKLALQFGVLDNFYVSGEVSGNGHVWSMAAIDSDYTEKTWEIGYRSSERTYDYEGEVLHEVPLAEGIPDVDTPGTGYIWADVARHGLTHRNYGEFVETHWCGENPARSTSPKQGTPLPASESCPADFVRKGRRLPSNVGDPRGSASPWPWPVPMIARDQATMPELRGHFDPRSADFRLDYPDQLRADEFINEFQGFVKARETGRGTQLPQFIILRLPDDHTAGTRPGMPKPEASVGDNDLAVGRVVEAISHSPYWSDTAIFILEDDAQDGPDHVDAHRSTALVISKYSPGSTRHPFVDSNFYTTVSMVRTMEILLGLPPMNNNDARASVMAPLFSGSSNQPPFSADYRNQKNGLIYQMNTPKSPGAKMSERLDFTHADAANSRVLNEILWRERKGNIPMPPPKHTVVLPGED